MEYIDCLLCNEDHGKIVFSKASGDGEYFTLVKCLKCGLRYISPRPDKEQIHKYYESGYFLRRTDRGYNDYFSDKVRREIERVIALNLSDLDFFEYEKGLGGDKMSLDIGCAAGYFVRYLKNRNWISHGIDISEKCIDYARRSGLEVICGDYLETEFKKPFNLITLWASIEHLHYPDKFLEKIFNDLQEDGILYISTCRTGLLSFMKIFGKKWRFYNFPEHLYFFSLKTIKELLDRKGFELVKYITYGSGVGRPGSLLRKCADHTAKKINAGDMMLISAIKKRNRT